MHLTLLLSGVRTSFVSMAAMVSLALVAVPATAAPGKADFSQVNATAVSAPTARRRAVAAGPVTLPVELLGDGNPDTPLIAESEPWLGVDRRRSGQPAVVRVPSLRFLRRT